MLRLSILLLFVGGGLLAQSTEAEIYAIGGDVKAPKVLKKPEPSYSAEARERGISGEVWLECVIDAYGLPRDIVIISPLGYGLDERALETIAKWTFRPATKAGVPVSVRATIAVAFHLRGGFTDKSESQRGRYNSALHQLNGADAKRKAKAVERLRDLARQKYPPAMFLYGFWLREGTYAPADPAAGSELIQNAADKRFGPALYELGRMHLRGDGMPLDAKKGGELILVAANVGSDLAQLYLGMAHEAGSDGYEKSDDRARQFFRLCAASGRGECQFRLGRSLLNRPQRRGSDFTQAIAWLELADAQGSADAHALIAPLLGGLTEKQRSDADQLKPKLARRN